MYKVQKKAIAAVQKGTEHAVNEIYDEQKKVIKKAQDSLTPSQKKEVNTVIVNLEKDLNKTVEDKIEPLKAEMLSEINKSNVQIESIVRKLDNEKEKYKTGFWTTLISTIASVLGLIIAFLNIKAKSLEIEKYKTEIEKMNRDKKDIEE